jgi:hypothetical protein
MFGQVACSHTGRKHGGRFHIQRCRPSGHLVQMLLDLSVQPFAAACSSRLSARHMPEVSSPRRSMDMAAVSRSLLAASAAAVTIPSWTSERSAAAGSV